MSELQSPQEFLSDFISLTKQAQKRIFMQSMNFESGNIMSALEKVLIDAASRGVRVEVHCDWISQRYVHEDLPILPVLSKKKREYGRKVHQQNLQMRQRLINAGVTITEVNVPSRLTSWLPVFRRDHKKIYIIDDTAWLGGINLFDKAFDMVDIMVKFADHGIVTALNSAFDSHENGEKGDYKLQCASHYALYVDTGIVGKSLIYNTARKKIEAAKKDIVFMSQYVPDSTLLESLVKAAKRGVHVSIITSPRDDRKFNEYPEKLAYQFFIARIKPWNNIEFIHLQKNVHGKLLFVDQSTAFFGSHNLTHIGPILGTEEIMMESDDPQLVSQFKSFVNLQHRQDMK